MITRHRALFVSSMSSLRLPEGVARQALRHVALREPLGQRVVQLRGRVRHEAATAVVRGA